MIELMKAPWKMHEFFAGSGLAGYGLQGMFSPIWSNDISPEKADVFRANFGDDFFVLEDIKNIIGSDLPEAHLSWASFPCQDLSLAGKMSGITAERSGLVWEWLRVLDEMDEPPRILVLENVTGLLSSNDGKNYEVVHKALVNRGYKVGAIVVNASLFVPQSRPRVFVMAVQEDIAIPEHLSSNGPCWLHTKSAREIGESLDGWIWWSTSKPERACERLSDIVEADAPYDKDEALNLIPPKHRDKLKSVTNGYFTGYRRTRNKKQVLEIRFDGIAGCLRTPEGGSSKQYLIHVENGEAHARLLTVRETARLMGAPDSFELPGTYNNGYKAMGDAVVKPVIQFLGERFLLELAEAAYGR